MDEHHQVVGAQACSAAVTRVLGPAAVTLLPPLAAMDINICGRIIPAFLSAISTGPSSPAGSSGRSISEWRRQRRELPLELSQLLQDTPRHSLAAALQEATTLLTHVQLEHEASQHSGARGRKRHHSCDRWNLALRLHAEAMTSLQCQGRERPQAGV